MHASDAFSTLGTPLEQAKSVMILTHGRGASAGDILTLAEEFSYPDTAYLAPQASGHSWYPYSFLAPIPQNEPGISSGIAVLKSLVDRAKAAGIPSNRIVLGGFSQGACLTSEFVARHPDQYGAVMIFTGGVIGPEGTARNYSGRLDGVPIFIGSGDNDPHVPLWRVDETEAIFTQMGATVHKTIYPGRPHTISIDEVQRAKQLLDQQLV